MDSSLAEMDRVNLHVGFIKLPDCRLPINVTMCFPDQVTVMIIAYNEEANIARTLQALSWARHILVVDSGSTDSTLAIVRTFPQARVVTREFDSFANQCNFGLTKIDTTWVLSLDADYEISRQLSDEITSLSPREGEFAFRASFIYRVYGHSLRSTLYPSRTVLYRKDKATYRDEGHGHRVIVDGKIVDLKGPIYHDDRKPLSRWLESQQRYAKSEADHLMTAGKCQLGRKDRIRRLGWPAPLLVFAYTLLVKGCILDGWPGWMYVLQRTLAETMIAIEIVDRRLVQ